jgi:hypothetical protein
MVYALISRIRKIAFSCALLAGSTSIAAAQSTEYQGAGFLTDFVGCSDWSGISQIYARFRPAGQPGNQSYNAFNMFSRTFAFGYRFNPDPPLNEWFDVTAVGTVGGDFGFNSNPEPRPQIRLLATPPFTTGTDREMHVIFEVRNFSYQQGCRARGNFLLYRTN